MKAIFRQLEDPRYFQIIYLGLFLLFGIFELNWETNIPGYVAIIVVSIGTQLLFARFTNKKYTSWKSALITGIGLCLLLKSNYELVLMLGAFLAIASKFLIRSKGKHIFNPSNFGIIVAIMLTGEAWISPGQWGSSTVVLYFIGAAALMILFKVGRVDTSLIFILTLFGLDILYSIAYLGWDWSLFVHKATNGTTLLFTFFMITDPVTTPNHKKSRIIWAVALGVISFVMINKFFIHTAPLWVLFFISPFTWVLDKIYVAEKFEWVKRKNVKILTNK
jgi:Na+-transporting NADH:ubiquinone oxidoreductase subunit NqrB